MYNFNIVLTEKCNANCSHCYMKKKNNNNNLRSLTKLQVDEIIKKIPNNTKKIVLTGGEVFTEKELLTYTIDKINSLQKNIDIEIESNGIYFYKGNTLEKLLEFNNKITYIRFSDDTFHENGGVDLRKVRELKKYQSNVKYKIRYLVQDKALKIGKAKNLNEDYIKKSNCMNTNKTELNPYFFLDIEGNIYLCAWKLTKPIGNIFRDEIEDVLDRMNEPFNKKVLSGKIEEAFALEKGNEEEYKRYTKKYGQCMLCEKFYWK